MKIDDKKYPKCLRKKTIAELRTIIKDCNSALATNPNNPTTEHCQGKINYCIREINRRKKNPSLLDAVTKNGREKTLPDPDARARRNTWLDQDSFDLADKWHRKNSPIGKRLDYQEVFDYLIRTHPETKKL